MKITQLVSAIVLVVALAVPAAAEFRTVSRAYELSLSDVTVPPTLNSRISFKKCSDCEIQAVRVTPETRYSVNGRNVRFERFKSLVSKFPRDRNVPVSVMHHLESDTVVEVSVTYRQ